MATTISKRSKTSVILCVLFLVQLSLSGCREARSTHPLLDLTSSTAVLGKTVGLLPLNPDHTILLNKEKQANYSETRFRGQQYFLDLEGTPIAFSFHALPGLQTFWLMQIVPENEDTVIYTVARLQGDILYIDKFEIDDITLAAAQNNGINLPVEDSVQFSNRDELLEVARLYTQINLGRLNNLQQYDSVVRLGNTKSQRAQLHQSGKDDSCLAFAAHPQDPSVARLHGKSAYGVQLHMIALESAQTACELAAATTENPSVRYALARVYFQQGRFSDAIELVDALVKEGFPLAMVLKSQMQLSGKGYVASRDAAEKTINALAELDSSLGRYYRAYFNYFGVFGTPDHAQIRREMENIVAQTDLSAAKTQLAIMLLNGEGGSSQENRAWQLFDEAATENDIRAVLNLGKMQYFGNAVEIDRSAAFERLELAANLGLVEAQYFAGYMLSRGQGVDVDYHRAVDYLSSASAHNIHNATAELGILYYQGKGVERDEVKGRELVEKAASDGSPLATQYLAEMDRRENRANTPSAGHSVNDESTVQQTSSRLEVDAADVAHMREREDWTFVFANEVFDAYAVYPYCRDRNGEARIALAFNHRSTQRLMDRNWLIRWGRQSLVTMGYWGWNLCLSKWGYEDKPFPVVLTSYYQGQPATRLSFDYLANYKQAFTNIVLEQLIEPLPTETEPGATLAALEDIKLIDYDNYRAIPTALADYRSKLDALKSTASATDLAHITYLEGHVTAIEQSYGSERVDDPRAGDFRREYAGPEGERLFELASSLGHAGATLELAESVGLTSRLYDYAIALEHGEVGMPNAVASVWRESGHLMATALSQKIGHLIELKHRIEQKGGLVSGTRLGLNPNAPPTGTGMENAINRAMAQQFNSRSDAFSALTLFPRNLAWQCDEHWCAAMGGLVKMRINTRAPYQCQPVVNGATACEFAVKFLVRAADWIKQGGHPGEAILQGIVGVNTAGLRARANFVQQNGRWQIPAGEWVDFLD